MSPESQNGNNVPEELNDPFFFENNLAEADFSLVKNIAFLLERRTDFKKKTKGIYEAEGSLELTDILDNGIELKSANAFINFAANDIQLFIQCDRLIKCLEKRISSGHQNGGNLRKIIDNYLELAKPRWLRTKINKENLKTTYEEFTEKCPTDFFEKTKNENISFWEILEYCDKKRQGGYLKNSEYFLIASYFKNIKNTPELNYSSFDIFTFINLQIIPYVISEKSIKDYDIGNHIKGETPAYKNEILTKIRKVLFVIDDFSFQVTDALADNFDVRHKISKALVEDETIFGDMPICLRVIGDDVLSGLSLIRWLLSIKENYKETNDEFYKKLEEKMLFLQKEDESKLRLLFTSEFNDLFIKTVSESQDNLTLDINHSFESICKYQNELSKETLIFEEFENCIPNVVNKQVDSTLVVGLEKKLIGVVVDVVQNDKKHFKGMWFLSFSDDEPILYLDVVDQENISDPLKSKILLFTKEKTLDLKERLEKKYLEKLSKLEQEKANFKPILIKVDEKKIPSKLPDQELKKKRKNGIFGEAPDLKETMGNTIEERNIGYKLVFHEEVVNPDKNNPSRLKKAIEKFNKTGAGIVKMLNKIFAKSGNRIITLRTGSFRALFEVSEKNNAHLVRVVNRRDYQKLNGNCI
jgi:hypothetical protein